MKSVKIKLCLIIAFALAFIACMGAFVGELISRADRTVTLSGTSIFNVSGDAEIWAHRVENKITGEEGEEDDPYYYTMFTFEHDSDAVNYRRNLAYKWFFDKNDEDDYLSNEEETPDFVSPEMGEGYFSMEIGFEEVNFDKFVITFEAQQYRMTEDEKTVNYIIFLPEKNGNEQTGKLRAVITGEKDIAESEAKDIDVSGTSVSLEADHIVIALSGGDGGEYTAKVFNAAEGEIPEDKIETGVFKNIGEMYAKYVSSSTKPVTPLSFKADMPEKEGEEDKTEVRARMALYEMNGQSFALNRDSNGNSSNFRDITEVNDGDGKSHYTGGQVNDTTPPVLCLDTGISHIAEGDEISFKYTAIDVLTQSPSIETGYFILSKEQAADSNFNANDYTAENLYRTVKDSDDQYIYPHANHYVPTTDNYNEECFANDYVPEAAVKIYLKLTDTSSTGGQSTYIFLDWYVKGDYKITVNDYSYIAVANDKEGAYYNRDYEDGWEALIKEYQDKVDEAAKDLRAGLDDFYLPSFEKLVKDNSTAYADMTFSIYYMADGSKSSATGKNASNLSLDLNNAGEYLFTVYAHDADSNEMWYLKEVESEAPEAEPQYETVEFEASEIWTMYDDEKLHDQLPWFKFTVGISDISIEEPEEQETAYVGTSYTADSFEVKGISTKTVYSLYRFNNDLYAADNNGQSLTYEHFMETKKDLFEGEGRKYFTHIMPVSELESGSEEYELFSKYNWNSSSRSFVPQDENAFYLIKCEVTSTQFPTIEPVKAYMGIAASVTPRPIPGEDTWVQDNMASIILLSIAGAAFIGIILLLVIKPKEKGDIDEQFEKEVAAKSKQGEPKK